MHDSARSGYHTAASMVAHLRSELPSLLRLVYWASFSNPCCNVFKPLYMNGPSIPADLGKGTSTYAADAPWWWANRVKLFCDLNHNALAPRVREAFDATERWEMDRQQQVEGKRGSCSWLSAEAVGTLAFTDENCARRKGIPAIRETLPAALKATGVQYLFVDYMKSGPQIARAA
jgi:dipeptidase